ncbi:hypothetical protein CsatA_022542 [Cannabis sativa]
MSNTIQHFSHSHPLKQYHDIRRKYRKEAKINCGLCQLLVEDDQICYDCYKWECVYPLHKTCAELPQYLNHGLHDSLHGPLMLQKRSSSNNGNNNNNTTCYYCENPFQHNEVFAYVCNQCSLHMHMTCALITIPILTCDKDNNVQYFCHQQLMMLVDHDNSKDQAQCFVCRSSWLGLAYSCTYETCKNFLHSSCAKFPWKVDNSHSHHHSLALQFSKPQSCDLCCKKHCRLIFKCHDGCNFNLCTECVFVKTRVSCQSHVHSLYFVEKAFYKGNCSACQKSYADWSEHDHYLVPDEISRTQSFLFRCIECDYNLHFLCGPLPSTIKFKYHIHPLTLIDHQIKKDDHYDQFYCDICEEERNPYFRIYCCKDCDYSAHIHCLFSEIMKEIKGDKKVVNKLISFGETRWTQLIDRTEDTSNDQQNLGEVLSNSLIDEDKEMLNDPFTFGSSSEDKTFVERRYQFIKTEINAPILDHQLFSIETIYNINEFPSFNSVDFWNFYWELRYYKHKSGMKLDDKYLGQKVVDINGYKVPITLAHILNTLLHYYTESDLFGARVANWTPGIKSVFATIFCIVCDQMCRTKMKDVTKDVLQDWFFYLNAIAGKRYRNNIRLKKFIDKIIKRFFCFEAIRYEKDIKEKLMLRIVDLEDELKKCKEKLHMFNTHMSWTFEKIKNPINDALRLEEKYVDEIICFDELLNSEFEAIHFP